MGGKWLDNLSYFAARGDRPCRVVASEFLPLIQILANCLSLKWIFRSWQTLRVDRQGSTSTDSTLLFEFVSSHAIDTAQWGRIPSLSPAGNGLGSLGGR
jgi:hypothetical protein